MPTVTIDVPQESLDQFKYLVGKLGEPPGSLASEVFSVGLKYVARKRKSSNAGLGDQASEFKDWLEAQGYSNNTARTTSSLARKLLRTLAERQVTDMDESETFMSDPLYIAGTMKQPSGARRAWELWSQYCTAEGHDPYQLER